MFGADAAQVSFLETEGQQYETRHQDTLNYLFPKFNQLSPWQQTGQHRKKLQLEDFILIAEFSEQEGPRPVIVIPKDGGQDFDQNEFSVKILAVDHQSSVMEGCEMTEDAQVVMSDPDTDTHAFIHHIVLNDIQARGYVRPFCVSYVTSDPLKIMKCYEEISSQLRKVARLMKYGNRLVFMRDLEKYQEDLSYTKAHLLLSQNRTQVSTQGDSDLLNALNTLRQSMEEVKDIISNLKPLIQVDTELSERFQLYERELKSRHRQSDTDSDSSSLKEYGSKSEEPCPQTNLSGSYTDRTSPEFSLFSKVKDQKPKLLDVSTIRGKRRFDRSLRGLHELCSWGAKEGLQRLRAFREFLKRDLTSIYVDELDMSALVPEKGALCFSNNTVGANFLSTSGSIRNSCCVKRKVSEVTFHHPGLTSLGSVESFKSLSSSFQSFYDDDTMYSANSSMVDTVSSGFTLERLLSQTSSKDQESLGLSQEDGELQFHHDSLSDISNFFEGSGNDEQNTLLDTLKAGEIEVDVKGVKKDIVRIEQNLKTMNYQEIEKDKLKSHQDLKNTLDETSEVKDVPRERSISVNSDFDNIDIEKDLKCNARGCACEKEKRPLTKNDCSTNNNRAKLGNQSVKVVQCNIGTGTNDINVLNVEVKKEVCGTGNLMLDISEELSENNADLTPVMTDSNSTLGDLFSVIPEGDYHSNAENNESIKDIAESYHTDTCMANISNLDESTDKKATENKTEPVDNGTLDVQGDKGQSKKGTEMPEDAKQTLNENDLKDTDKEKATGQLGIGSDNSVDINNIQKKETSLDFKGTGENRADKEMTRKDDEHAYLDLGNSYHKHGHNVHGEVGLAYGAADKEKTSGMDASKKRKWKFMHPFKNILDGESSISQSLQKVLSNYNNLQHIVYSLLIGRPVVVLGTRRQEVAVKELVQALSVFVPYTPRSSSMGIVCQLKQLKISDVHTFQLRGMIRSDKRSVDYLFPKSVRRYVTFVDTEKGTVYCLPYQGILLNFISSIHSKKKTFKSDAALLSYVQLCLQEMSTKAFSFYHTVTASNEQFDFSGATLPHKSSMVELSLEKYLNRAGVHNSDCRIIKNLTEIVKLQQIEEEFRSKYLTDAPSYPFSVSYQSLQTYKL